MKSEIEIVSPNDCKGKSKIRDKDKVIEKKLAYNEIMHGFLHISRYKDINNFISKIENIDIVDFKDGDTINSRIDKNLEDYRIFISKFIQKYDITTSDIVRIYIDSKNNKIYLEFIKTEIKKLTFVKSRNQVIVALNINLLRQAGFEPGGHVKVLYTKDKMIINNIIN